MRRFKVLDVLGDGSCFFRALYHSAKSVYALKHVLRRFGILVKDATTEDEFVGAMRNALSDMVLNKKDKHVIRDVYANLLLMDKDSYKLALASSFPAWFAKAFKKLPQSEEAFVAKFAAGVLRTSSWASEIEVRIIQERLRKFKLVILNSKPSKKYVIEDNTIYLLNLGEAHYNALVVYMKDEVDKTDAKDKQKQKDCGNDKIYNEKTKRCVKRTSCKGYELTSKAYAKILGI